jgi:hypothetical protein
MSGRRPRGTLRGVMAFCLVLGCGVGDPAHAQDSDSSSSSCPLGFDAYSGFIVRHIAARPFLPLPAVSISLPFISRPLDEALAAAQSRLRGAGIEVGAPFTPAGMSRLGIELNQEIADRRLRSGTGVSYVVPRLENCDDRSDPRAVDVEYRVFTIGPPTYLTSTFELHDRPDGDKEAARVPTGLRLRPYLGYNDSRRVYGGSRISFLNDSGLVDRLELQASASGNSFDVDLGVGGSRQFSHGPLEFAEWRLGYTRSDIPGDTIRLNDETFLAQLFVASRPIRPLDLVLRFGTSLEGGRHDTNVPQADLPADTVQDSAYGSAKFYVGGSGNYGRHEWKASYGLQLGSTLDRAGLDYYKHVVDTAYRARFLPRAHLPFQLDAGFTGGFLGSLGGKIPAGERFFGGNAEQNLIQGDSWHIRSNPVIRSFAQNRFNSVDGRPIGGDRFAAINLTIAQTVWSRPLLPADVVREVVRDPGVAGALSGQLVTARLVLREDAIQAKSREHKELSDSVQGLTPVLDRLKGEIEPLRSIAEYETLVADVLSQVEAVEESVSGAKPQDPQPGDQVREELPVNPVEVKAVELVRGDPDVEIAPLLTSVENAVQMLREQVAKDGRKDVAARLGEVERTLRGAQTGIDDRLRRLQQLRAYDLKELDELLGPLRRIVTSTASPASPTLAAIRQELEQLLTARKAARQALPAPSPDRAVRARREQLSTCITLLDAAIGFLDKAASSIQAAVEGRDKGDSSGAKNAIEQVAVGFGGVPSHLGGLVDSIADLPKMCPGDDLTQRWDALQRGARGMSVAREQVTARVKRLHVPQYEAEANQTVNYIGRIVNVFFNELNLVSLSPVLMLDVADIGSKRRPLGDDLRSGVGLGVRLGLVNVDFTVGYSVNPEPRRGEARGAFVFMLTINDLFR